jgi:dipeptidase
MCDTFVCLQDETADGSVIFGKNSDREPNEAQALEYHPPKSYDSGDTLRCTYITIPQVRETHGILISRPFWMWGCEMGANEKGLVIGNEAVFTRMPYEKQNGLTGMDLQRLALERSATAEQALETMVQLLSDHGQGGLCGYEDTLVYHNSFILADPETVWVLETAGPLWAALKVKDIYAISNGLTIGEAFDRSHPELIDTARKKGWQKKGQNFHFAKAYSDWFYTTFSGSRGRRGCSLNLLTDRKGNIDASYAIRVLRDHGPDCTRLEDYRPDSHLLLDRLCAHAAYDITRKAAQSTGSFVAHLKPDCQTFFVTGTSAPCTGIFKPVWLQGKVLPDIGPSPAGSYNPDSLWWHHEQFHREVLSDYPSRAPVYFNERDELERSLIQNAMSAEGGDRWTVTNESFMIAKERTAEWTAKVREQSPKRRPGMIYRYFWNKQNRKAGI